MTIAPDGIRAAADRESEFHPTKGSKPITAWQRRADTLEATVAAVNNLEARVAELEARPSTPFPG